MPEEILRTFIAIELDQAVLRGIARAQDTFKRAIPPGAVRWVAPEGIHLTLKFLGDTPATRVAEIEAALQRACAGFAPFEFSVEGRGVFPNITRPRVIWVAARERGQLLHKLNAAVEREVAPLGWPTEDRAFSPHLTLGRVTRDADRRAEAAVGAAIDKSVVEQIGVQRVTQVSLIKSQLLPTGAVYTPLLHVPLS